jgi:methyl-accepting chemotaxis protein
MFAQMALKKRMVVIGLVSLISLLFIGTWSAVHQRSKTYEERQLMLQALVDSMYTQIGYYQNLEKTGKLSTQEAQKQARESMRGIRFQGNNYFFIYTYEGITILLPPMQDKEGQSRIDVKDAHGVPLTRNIIDAAKAGGGFTRYDFPRAGQTEALPKIAYSRAVDGWNWVVGSGLYVDDIEQAFYRDLLTTGGVILLLSALVFGLIFTISRSVLTQLGGEPTQAMQIMQQVASGNLQIELEVKDKNSLLGELSALIHSLRTLISGIHAGAEQIRNASHQIKESSDAVASAASMQSGATQGMAASMEQLTVSISHISDNAAQTEHSAGESVTAALRGEEQVNTAVGSMHTLSNAIEGAGERITGLSQQAQEVGSIAATIKEISDQTNLLALNAAIEAARAGETGRGFAVVADEVRKLAERTGQATSELEKSLSKIQLGTESAVEAMLNAASQAGKSVDDVGVSASILKQIAQNSAQARQLIGEVATSTREQRIASTSLAQQVESIAQAAEETSSGMLQTARSADHLEQVADQLYHAVSRFRC